MWDSLKARLKPWIGIDTRALAIFRVLLGLLVAADAVLRARNFGFLYLDSGAVSMDLARLVPPDPAFSLFFLLPDHPAVAAFLFVLKFVFGLLLAVGFRSRFAAFACFLLVVSFDHRNFFVLSYADFLFALLLFWGLFLPLGERWSLDSLNRESTRTTVVGLASAVILLQMVSMYFVNGLHKLQSETWLAGREMKFILHSDEMTYLLGDLTRLLPDQVLYLGNYSWMALLLASPLLLVLKGRYRSALAGVFIAGHLGLALTVRIGAFPFVTIAGLVLFLSPASMDHLEDWFRDSSKLNLADRRQALAVWLELAPELSVPEAPEKARKAFRVAALVVLVFSSGYMVVSNAETAAETADLIDAEDDSLVEYVDDLMWTFHIDQPDWTIFAPESRSRDFYFVFAAEDDDGVLHDVYSDRALSFERPHTKLNRQYSTYRERFYMEGFRRSHVYGRNGWAPEVELADYHCRESSASGTSDITRLNLYVVYENIHDTEDVHLREERPRNTLLWLTHLCDPSEAGFEVLATPPAEFEPFEGGSEPAPSRVDARLDLPEPPDDLECVDEPAVEGWREVNWYLREVEHDNLVTFGETATSVGMATVSAREAQNGLQAIYQVRVYTEERGMHSPRYYQVVHTFSEDFVHRQVLPREDVLPRRAQMESGFAECFS